MLQGLAARLATCSMTTTHTPLVFACMLQPLLLTQERPHPPSLETGQLHMHKRHRTLGSNGHSKAYRMILRHMPHTPNMSARICCASASVHRPVHLDASIMADTLCAHTQHTPPPPLPRRGASLCPHQTRRTTILRHKTLLWDSRHTLHPILQTGVPAGGTPRQGTLLPTRPSPPPPVAPCKHRPVCQAQTAGCQWQQALPKRSAAAAAANIDLGRQ